MAAANCDCTKGFIKATFSAFSAFKDGSIMELLPPTELTLAVSSVGEDILLFEPIIGSNNKTLHPVLERYLAPVRETGIVDWHYALRLLYKRGPSWASELATLQGLDFPSDLWVTFAHEEGGRLVVNRTGCDFEPLMFDGFPYNK